MDWRLSSSHKRKGDDVEGLRNRLQRVVREDERGRAGATRKTQRAQKKMKLTPE
jgi:hypothetical protein